MPDSPLENLGTLEQALADRYRFEGEIGRGAMGTVFRAHDLRLNRLVAIKTLHPVLTNELGSARFASEIRIAAALHHPNIVSVHDSGTAAGRLYYVMDFLGGESLRARLDRERQLGIADALRIAQEVARGLQYAHDHGVVHRDVKPENIILTAGGARLVDFGLARALTDGDAARLTASGFAVGTPQYLSPEQAAAERHISPAADQYALACVVHEMLVGEPPFSGPTAAAIAMRHIASSPEPIRTVRKSAPRVVEAAVLRALEKVPADRFPSVQEFANALSAVPTAEMVTEETIIMPAMSSAVRPTRRRRGIVLSAGAFALVAVAATALSARGGSSLVPCGMLGRCLDTASFVVVSAGNPSGDVATSSAPIERELARWRGLSPVAHGEVRAQLGRDGEPVTIESATRASRSLKAGRAVVLETTNAPSGSMITARLIDAASRAELSRASVVIPASGAISDSAATRLVYGLLFAVDAEARYLADARGTTSVQAFRAYLAGQMALRTWNLVGAKKLFSDALAADAEFPQAALALAQTQTWLADEAPELDGLLTRAARGEARLTDVQRTHRAALAALQSEAYPEACARFDSLVTRDSTDFGAWYGAAECRRRDRAVMPDPRSPSGFRFRASEHRVSTALQHAFALLPTIDACCLERADEVQRRHLSLESNAAAMGTGIDPSHRRFVAFAELIADTIALIPWPVETATGAPPATRFAALDRQRRQFLNIARRRAAQAPSDPAALEELADALDRVGGAGALDTLRLAKTTATSESHRLRLATKEVWLRLKLELPHDSAGLAGTRALADSLLAKAAFATAPGDYARLSALAALTGQTDRAAVFASRSVVGEPGDQPPLAVRQLGYALLTYAAAAGPADSIRSLEGRLLGSVANLVLPEHRAMVEATLIGQAAQLAFPVYRSRAAERDRSMSPLGAAQLAFARGETAEAKRQLAKRAAARAAWRPADLTLDALYPEASLLAAVGDTASARRLLEQTLESFPFSATSELERVGIAGSLVQSARLLGDLTTGGGAAAVNPWARAARLLTRGAAQRTR